MFTLLLRKENPWLKISNRFRTATSTIARNIGSSLTTTPKLSSYTQRHIGPQPEEHERMFQTIGVSSIDELLNQVIPSHIRLDDTTRFDLPSPCEDHQALQELKTKMNQNKIFRSFIGMGYYNTHLPAVILRNMLENPSWYTPYTPYQAEISQGRLEMLLNFQTMVASLVGKPLCNSSLLDEGTACAEAMTMCLSIAKPKGDAVFLVSDDCHPQNIDVVKTRAEPLGIVVELVSNDSITALLESSTGNIFGVLVQYPDTNGSVDDWTRMAEIAHQNKCLVVAATDILACALLAPPGEWGADIVVGSAQRFGVPLGYGGPHAAFIATDDKYVRRMPGRIIGVSADSRGKTAYRMALQTRETHIRRDKATSNICTAQALLANINAAYGLFHGADGIQAIAQSVHSNTRLLFNGLMQIRAETKSFELLSNAFFDTITIKLLDTRMKSKLLLQTMSKSINLRSYFLLDKDLIGISLDETTERTDINDILDAFAAVFSSNYNLDLNLNNEPNIPLKLQRRSQFMQHEIFTKYHSETAMMRYLYSLERKDLGLNTAMIPLGSCTMKLNSANVMLPVTWETVANIHPFVPAEQATGYTSLINDIEYWLAEMTGFDSVSLQPNSGAQGEYTGLLCIREYHKQHGELDRNICLIPVSAHGTNPASAAMVGWKIVAVNCDSEGNIDVEHLTQLAEKHSRNLAAVMITYPSTHGVFEDSVQEVIQIVHRNGGLVYMDGANFQAQLGYTSPARIGADVCHLNLHKTFCIPHGGGGPGLGPIGVAKHLTPYLPTHHVMSDIPGAIGAVASAPYSSASILVISWMYIRMMGQQGLTKATQAAILNANYMASRLGSVWPILYLRHGRCAHEFIIDIRKIQTSHGISAEDVAKRLADYSFHAPTMSFPVQNTLMIEPTESEPLAELDRMCDALVAIRKEVQDVEDRLVALDDSPLRAAPHTVDMVMADHWDKKYSRAVAAVDPNKPYWPTVGRVDNAAGDRSLQCSCPPVSYFAD